MGSLPMESVLMDSDALIETLHTYCIAGSEEIEFLDDSENGFQLVKKNLKLWASGLFREDRDVPLARVLYDMGFETLSQHIVGTLADIVGIIGTRSSLESK